MHNNVNLSAQHLGIRHAFSPQAALLIDTVDKVLDKQPSVPHPINPNHLTKVVCTRITEAEHLHLSNNAISLDMSFSQYIRSLIVDEKTQKKLIRLAGTKQRQVENAKILSALSQTRIANNLNALAKGLHTSTLHFTPEVIAQINEAYDMVMDIRQMLILGQRLRK